MRRLLATMLPIALLGGCATVTKPASSLPDLDALLGFDDPALCRESARLTAFMGEMVTGDANIGFRPGRIAASPELASAFGAIEVRAEDGYTVVSVSVRGSWLGLPLVAVHQGFPEGGDPGDFSFELAARVPIVERQLRAAGFPVRAGREVQVGPPEGYTHVMTLVADPDRPGHSLFGCGFY